MAGCYTMPGIFIGCEPEKHNAPKKLPTLYPLSHRRDAVTQKLTHHRCVQFRHRSSDICRELGLKVVERGDVIARADQSIWNRTGRGRNYFGLRGLLRWIWLKSYRFVELLGCVEQIEQFRIIRWFRFLGITHKTGRRQVRRR